MKLPKLLVLLVIGYTNASFQVSNIRSVDLTAASEYKEHTSKLEFHKIIELDLDKNKVYKIKFGQHFTSLKLTQKGNIATTVLAQTRNEKFVFGKAEMDLNIEIPSNFVILKQKTDLLIIKTKKSTLVELELFYAPSISIPSFNSRNKKFDCDKPTTIPQSQWRAGLPEPDSGRVEAIVKHCIIHHSAGSNSDTNYINTVRNIYLLHTQSNGWDDIGYNFIIAPNGVIFSGRDAHEVADEDNIQGAHFCGKNGGTMGICLLGNYNLASPTQPMKTSLLELLSWKLYKEEIDANVSFPHPTALDDQLGSIAMHRDGCATSCPGDSVSLILNNIRYDVQQQLDLCRGIAAINKQTKAYKQLVYPNPSSGKFYALIEKTAHISSYKIIDAIGKEIIKADYPNSGKIEIDVPDGYYFIELWNENIRISVQKIKIERY